VRIGEVGKPGLDPRIASDRTGEAQEIVFGHSVHKRNVESIVDIITCETAKIPKLRRR
jgi:hypothetical protein